MGFVEELSLDRPAPTTGEVEHTLIADLARSAIHGLSAVVRISHRELLAQLVRAQHFLLVHFDPPLVSSILRR